MKFAVFALSAVLVSSTNAFAQDNQGCMASFAVGIGHVMKGEALDITPRDRFVSNGTFNAGGIKLDIVTSSARRTVSATRLDLRAPIALQVAKQGPFELYSAEIPHDMKGYAQLASRTPGAATRKAIYLIVMCTAR